eukprot:CAMPEP_0181203574 /NCGR_PEP_ID=MMETSP1096-20121128/19463_1 /TAXON_ID=156174 ORGANISM="Chrysochromulina ericina, Strain CCMP281" /NCGR_SAMPLE_ID=MMETSP1096 /ASSEMBLY_ACC=CAM_ASM_000453 /LENGTH=50 /DNA_ID=CAMNT_0023294193 /DNA_START=119 /DNA_END=271 /DNA_ORIENTATION=+
MSAQTDQDPAPLSWEAHRDNLPAVPATSFVMLLHVSRTDAVADGGQAIIH